MKKTILSLMLLAVCVTTVFSYSEGVHDFFNLYYSDANTDMEKTFSILETAITEAATETEKQTIKNVLAVFKLHSGIMESEKETEDMLKETLEENDPLLSENDPTYITSVADVMVSLMQFSSIFKIMALAGDASELYETSLEINPNHFQSLLGYGLATAYQPEFIGGGMEKALPILKRAENNASEKWEKHIIYIWLSQAYMQLEDAINYEKYIALAENVFSPGVFFDMVKSLNDDDNKSLFDTD